MSIRKFERFKKEDKPVIAICYDFDKTLSPDDMQAQGFIQSVGYDVKEFWKESNDLADENEMDNNLAYMFMMKEKAQDHLMFTKDKLMEYGSKVALFKGVDTWFQRINEYGLKNDIIIEHYIISSGLKEMIEGNKIAKEFKKIYASSFYFDNQGYAIWPAQAVNYTNKTQFLFRIEKGTLDINDPGVNEHCNEKRVPFDHMIYIGDSLTDIPCMTLIHNYGGYSIGVYDDDKSRVYKMLEDKRIDYYTYADYSEGSKLDSLVKAIINQIKTKDYLSNIHSECQKDNIKANKTLNAEGIMKRNLIISLENSGSFANTHFIINNLSHFTKFNLQEKKQLFRIANMNSQVAYILNEDNIRNFYLNLLKDEYEDNEDVRKIIKIIRP